jgi:hypothetical protein
MIQLNLLPDLKKEFINAQKTKGLVISVSILVTLGAMGLSALLFVYVTFVQQLQINLASDNIKRELTNLKSIENIDKYLTLQNQLKSLPELHAGKTNTSRVFNYLSVVNPSAPNNVTLGSLQLTMADHSLILTGSTATFETLNVFIDTLKNAQVTYKQDGQGDPIKQNMFDSVRIQAAGFIKSATVTLVGFTVKMTFQDPVFAATNTDVTASVPNITTTPSVTQSPNPVFNDEGTDGDGGE